MLEDSTGDFIFGFFTVGFKHKFDPLEDFLAGLEIKILLGLGGTFGFCSSGAGRLLVTVFVLTSLDGFVFELGDLRVSAVSKRQADNAS